MRLLLRLLLRVAVGAVLLTSVTAALIPTSHTPLQQSPASTLRADQQQLVKAVSEDSRFVAAEHGSNYNFSSAFNISSSHSDSITLVFALYGNEKVDYCPGYSSTRVLDQLYVSVPIVLGGYNLADMTITELGAPTVWFCPSEPSP